MVEILLSDLMFADDICVFWPSVRGLQNILDVCQAYAESHEIIFNCRKISCMTFKAKSAKSTVIPLLKLGVQRVKSVSHNKDLGIVWDTELRWQRYSDTTVISKAFFSWCSNAVKNILFRYFCTPMYASLLWCDFRKAYFERLFRAYLTLVAGHCTTYHGERILVVIRFNITFLPLRRHWYKMCTCFSKDAASLTTYGCALWCSQIIYIRTYSFNNTTAFYFVTEGPDVPVLVWGCVLCRRQRIRASLGIGLYFLTCDNVSYSGWSVVPIVTSYRTTMLRKCLWCNVVRSVTS